MTGRAPGEGGLSLCVLASGSRGNAVYISGRRASVLLDAGLSGIEIQRRLSSRGIDPADIDAIVVSHEHDDHIRGAGILSRRFDIPVYITPRTRRAAEGRLGRVHAFKPFETGRDFKIGDLTFQPFSISHDAEDPAGFAVSQNGAKIGIATDLGAATALVKERLKGCAALALEANHDPAMLMEGPYPWHIKQRIKGRTGHLSNAAARDLLEEIKHPGLRHVVLAHLSGTNNTASKALEEAAKALSDVDARLCAARQDLCGEMIRVTGGS
ncbi:MBL fold metallo-hydrolase [Candidatus Desulfarcum epimagneticum]|uniref:MBL fold metallo-hydrolase n=1 Tax=uncultured Desulfobacteraceae bacterium TaxID=218296 RepID=A0A484HF93_9BACT|nr:MBL fold metallo-hydrolase [uncultured Desulfobacteraceae bacterium]